MRYNQQYKRIIIRIWIDGDDYSIIYDIISGLSPWFRSAYRWRSRALTTRRDVPNLFSCRAVGNTTAPCLEPPSPRGFPTTRPALAISLKNDGRTASSVRNAMAPKPGRSIPSRLPMNAPPAAVRHLSPPARSSIAATSLY